MQKRRQFFFKLQDEYLNLLIRVKYNFLTKFLETNKRRKYDLSLQDINTLKIVKKKKKGVI